MTLTKPVQTNAFHIPGWNFQVDFCLSAPVRVTRKGWTHKLMLWICDVGWANSIKQCRLCCPSSLIGRLWGCENFFTEWSEDPHCYNYLLARSGALIAIPTNYWSAPAPTFSDHTGPQHWTFTFWATTAISRAITPLICWLMNTLWVQQDITAR